MDKKTAYLLKLHNAQNLPKSEKPKATELLEQVRIRKQRVQAYKHSCTKWNNAREGQPELGPDKSHRSSGDTYQSVSPALRKRIKRR